MGRDRVFTLLCSLYLGLCDVLNCYLWRPFSRNVMTSALTSLVRFGVLTSISSFRLAGTPFLDLCVRSHVPRIQMSAKNYMAKDEKRLDWRSSSFKTSCSDFVARNFTGGLFLSGPSPHESPHLFVDKTMPK